jgi:hypothetical protein
VESLRTFDERLRFAIANKRLIQVIYNSSARVAEPHDYGLKNGAAKLLAYQLHGGRPMSGRGWKLFDVSKIERIVVLEATFRGSRAQPHQQHTRWDALFARVG